VGHGLDDVAAARLALGPHHGRALADAAQGLAQVAASAHEGDLEVVLVDVILVVGRREDLGLVDEVHAEGLEDLRLGEVADACLGHHRDGDGLLDLADHPRVRHPGDAPHLADVRGNPFQGHDRHRTGVLGDLGLFGVGHIHDDPALEHLGQAHLVAELFLQFLVVPGCIHDRASCFGIG